MREFRPLSALRLASLLVLATTMMLWVAESPLAESDVLTFKLSLSGANEVPPNNSPGVGTAIVTFDKANRTLTWNVAFSGLTGPPTMAHFHGPSSPRAIAGIQIVIAHGQDIPNPIKGSAVLTEDQARQLLDGRWYINIHTQAHPGGEIRAQVVASP